MPLLSVVARGELSPDRAAVGRTVLGGLFIVAGVMHFIVPGAYRAIMPGYLPAPALLVALSGAAEVAGGIGLLVRSWRRAAGVALVLLLVAVFPANVEMLRQARVHEAGRATETMLWLRLPLQVVLVLCVWRFTRPWRGGPRGALGPGVGRLPVEAAER